MYGLNSLFCNSKLKFFPLDEVELSNYETFTTIFKSVSTGSEGCLFLAVNLQSLGLRGETRTEAIFLPPLIEMVLQVHLNKSSSASLFFFFFWNNKREKAETSKDQGAGKGFLTTASVQCEGKNVHNVICCCDVKYHPKRRH